MIGVSTADGYAEPIPQDQVPSDHQSAERAHIEQLRHLLRRHELAATRLRAAKAKQLGMSEIEGMAVAHIALHGELSQVRLSELLDLSAGGTAALVQRLEQEGRVMRRAAVGDRRIRLVALTSTMAAACLRFDRVFETEIEKAAEPNRAGLAHVAAMLEGIASAAEMRADRGIGRTDRRDPAATLTPAAWG